uniref:SET domain-containing protein n=1 Tax=Leersia perrieri TaxID=77586 RepID=A0A0D9XJL7_9ORYZ
MPSPLLQATAARSRPPHQLLVPTVADRESPPPDSGQVAGWRQPGGRRAGNDSTAEISSSRGSMFRRLLSTAAAARRPPPIRVALTESSGRGVFATRPIAAGELLHSAQPLVSHPSRSLLHEVCYSCLRRRNGGSGGDGDDSSGSCYFCGDACREHAKGFRNIEKNADWSLFDEHCSSRGLKYPYMVKRLAYPNTHIVWLETADARLKALCDIEEGEELRICYIDASMDVDARQKILADGFGFQCRCLRCLSGD